MERIVEATYFLKGGKAILEMAQSTGLMLVSQEKRRVLNASSYGLGEMIMDAYHQGTKEIILGVGGSASNDGGLGLRFRAKNGYYLPNS